MSCININKLYCYIQLFCRFDSFAIVVWEIITRKTPFSGPDYRFDSNVEEAVLNGTRPEIPGNTIEDLQNIVNQCWQDNPKSRPAFTDIVLQLQSLNNKLYPPSLPSAPNQDSLPAACNEFCELLNPGNTERPSTTQGELIELVSPDA